MTQAQDILFSLLRSAIGTSAGSIPTDFSDWEAVIDMAFEQGVDAISVDGYHVFVSLPHPLDPLVRQGSEGVKGKIVMGKYINKGNDGFASVCNTKFVDKSGLIEEVNSVLLTENRFLCVTRARRFGESVAVMMLNAFYDKSCDSRSLFEGLAICSHPDFEKHLSHYPHTR